MPTGPKPDKPYPDFPLFPHARGYWAKKIRGRMCYFGPWADPDAALELYRQQAPDLHAGRTPRPVSEGITVAELCNLFLAAKRQAHESDQLSGRMYDDYLDVCKTVAPSLVRSSVVAGLRAEDFARAKVDAAKRLGPVSLGIWIQRVRTIFKWGYESEHLEKPVRFGPGFAKPSRRAVRLQRAAGGAKLVSAADCRKLIAAARPPLDAMILLGLNAGLGQSDCSDLPLSAVDLDAGWLTFPRPKTGISRSCPLWPETIRALRAAIDSRPTAKDPADADCVFVTKYGHRWVRRTDRGAAERGTIVDAVALMFKRLVVATDTKAGGFYNLRRTFRTVADGVKDSVAVDVVMGHSDESMGAVYRQSVENERLIKVVEFVREWLFRS